MARQSHVWHPICRTAGWYRPYPGIGQLAPSFDRDGAIPIQDGVNSWKILNQEPQTPASEPPKTKIQRIAALCSQIGFGEQTLTKQRLSDSEEEVSAPLGKPCLAPGFRSRDPPKSMLRSTASNRSSRQEIDTDRRDRPRQPRPLTGAGNRHPIGL
jgi:hypothetical protein